MGSKKTLTVDIERIDQLLTALSFASADLFDEPGARVHVAADDEFGSLESAFAVFLTELAQAKASLHRAVAEIEASRNDLAAKLETIERQQLTIRELSTPVLDVADGVLTLPVVGVIDSQRAIDMTERLLARIVESGSRSVILDITGVEVVDTETADHLVRLTRTARLLGARCVVSGVSPAVARTLVTMGAELAGMETVRTLRDGIRTCLAKTG